MFLSHHQTLTLKPGMINKTVKIMPYNLLNGAIFLGIKADN